MELDTSWVVAFDWSKTFGSKNGWN